MRLSELLEIDFVRPTVGDALDIELDEDFVFETDIAEVNDHDVIINIDEEGWAFLEQYNMIDEAEYQGRKVKVGHPMPGDVKKYKVFVRSPKSGNIIKVNFGDPNMKIKRNIPGRRKSFRARHRCNTAKDRTSARYWSCRMWSKRPVSSIIKGK